jgi:hypothetical protein
MAKSCMQLSPSNRPENVPCHHIVAIALHLTASQHRGHTRVAPLMHNKCSVKLRETTRQCSRRAWPPLRVSTGLAYILRGRTGPLKKVHSFAVPARAFCCRYRAIEAELYVFWRLVQARTLGVAAIQGRHSDSHLALAPHSDWPFRRWKPSWYWYGVLRRVLDL